MIARDVLDRQFRRLFDEKEICKMLGKSAEVIWKNCKQIALKMLNTREFWLPLELRSLMRKFNKAYPPVVMEYMTERILSRFVRNVP